MRNICDLHLVAQKFSEPNVRKTSQHNAMSLLSGQIWEQLIWNLFILYHISLYESLLILVFDLYYYHLLSWFIVWVQWWERQLQMQEHEICPDLPERGVQRLKENKSMREERGLERAIQFCKVSNILFSN